MRPLPLERHLSVRDCENGDEVVSVAAAAVGVSAGAGVDDGRGRCARLLVAQVDVVVTGVGVVHKQRIDDHFTLGRVLPISQELSSEQRLKTTANAECGHIGSKSKCVLVSCNFVQWTCTSLKLVAS